MQTLRCFLYGVKFVIHTDHRPLLYLARMKEHGGRLARTLEDLGEFDFIIKYRPGAENYVADALSRMEETSAEGQTTPRSGLPVGLRVKKEVPGGGDSLFDSLLEIIRPYRENCRDGEGPQASSPALR